MLTDTDLRDLESRGISCENFERQIARFSTGFPYLHLEAAATVGDGIMRLSAEDEELYLKAWRDFRQAGGTMLKFVPASGAASRMFKNLYAFVNSGRMMPETDFERIFIAHIDCFAFFPQLDAACRRLHGMGAKELVAAGKAALTASALLDPEGLNYGALPKALLLFHPAVGKAHTPLEEHLEEGAQYAADLDGKVRLHFTVSPEHRKAFEQLLGEVVPEYEKKWGVTYDITMSEQRPSTDTVAVNLDNTPYRDREGHLLFRPAGHGALLENLNEQDADVIFVKNIDNVVPSARRESTIRFKQVIAGLLTHVQRKVADYALRIAEPDCQNDMLKEAVEFLKTTFSISNPATDTMSRDELRQFLLGKLNRPLRVCGVVKNEGEPGGGPYIVRDNDGSTSLQILEAAQINPDDNDAVSMIHNGTHFNPVDLVCYVKDPQKNHFDLMRYVDPDTGLISEKSVGGTPVKALELPGLWNGSMSRWNTIFVEVPIDTFNPVKTVNDLLREQHT